MNDPIIEEIRQYRKRHAEQFGNDLTRIIEDIRNREGASRRKVVSRMKKSRRDIASQK